MSLISLVLATQFAFEAPKVPTHITPVREDLSVLLEKPNASEYQLRLVIEFKDDGKKLDGDIDALAESVALGVKCESGGQPRLGGWSLVGQRFTVDTICTGTESTGKIGEGITIDYSDRAANPDASSYEVIARIQHLEDGPHTMKTRISFAMGFVETFKCLDKSEPTFDRSVSGDEAFNLHFTCSAVED